MCVCVCVLGGVREGWSEGTIGVKGEGFGRGGDVEAVECVHHDLHLGGWEGVGEGRKRAERWHDAAGACCGAVCAAMRCEAQIQRMRAARPKDGSRALGRGGGGGGAP